MFFYFGFILLQLKCLAYIVEKEFQEHCSNPRVMLATAYFTFAALLNTAHLSSYVGVSPLPISFWLFLTDTVLPIAIRWERFSGIFLILRLEFSSLGIVIPDLSPKFYVQVGFLKREFVPRFWVWWFHQKQGILPDQVDSGSCVADQPDPVYYLRGVGPQLHLRFWAHLVAEVNGESSADFPKITHKFVIFFLPPPPLNWRRRWLKLLEIVSYRLKAWTWITLLIWQKSWPEWMNTQALAVCPPPQILVISPVFRTPAKRLSFPHPLAVPSRSHKDAAENIFLEYMQLHCLHGPRVKD